MSALRAAFKVAFQVLPEIFRAALDDYLALSLIIMGIAIGALLVIWGAMSLAFFLRKKHRAKKIQERIAERKAAEAKYRAELQQEEQNSQNDN